MKLFRIMHITLRYENDDPKTDSLDESSLTVVSSELYESQSIDQAVEYAKEKFKDRKIQSHDKARYEHNLNLVRIDEKLAHESIDILEGKMHNFGNGVIKFAGLDEFEDIEY